MVGPKRKIMRSLEYDIEGWLTPERRVQIKDVEWAGNSVMAGSLSRTHKTLGSILTANEELLGKLLRSTSGLCLCMHPHTHAHTTHIHAHTTHTRGVCGEVGVSMHTCEQVCAKHPCEHAHT